MTDDITMNLENLQINDSPEINERKLFVGGLSWITTEDGLRQYFDGLGLNVDTVTIMRDKRGRSRGFGFLTLASPKEIEMAISFHLHIDGRKVEAKRAIPQSDMSNHAKKIFVGGLPVSLSNYDFRKYFESFGKVLESQIMTDRDSGRSRGFGFITFEEEKNGLGGLINRTYHIRKTCRGETGRTKKSSSPILSTDSIIYTGELCILSCIQSHN
jgi:RNA recognition motif-containing protein